VKSKPVYATGTSEGSAIFGEGAWNSGESVRKKIKTADDTELRCQRRVATTSNKEAKEGRSFTVLIMKISRRIREEIHGEVKLWARRKVVVVDYGEA